MPRYTSLFVSPAYILGLICVFIRNVGPPAHEM